jgi:RNA polymerase sigma factor (sigma-70 family)
MRSARRSPAGSMASTATPMDDVAAALDGDREALERLVRTLEPRLYRLAVRFFAHPQTAEDATQEALVQIVTKLDRFDGRSEFSTWAYRVATNRFLSMARSPAERMAMTLEEFSDDLATIPVVENLARFPEVDDALLAEEVKISCTTAMLLCLDRGHRLAYVLGEILELDHTTAAEVLEISRAAFRKRLQRARASITDLMRRRCGLYDPKNPCRCKARVPAAIDQGRIDPNELLFASSLEQARRFPEVLEEIRQIEAGDRAAALYRSHPDVRQETDFVSFVRQLFPA